jgi:hypothetical protein
MTLIVFNSCEEDDDSIPYTEQFVEITSGSADFTNMVSIGASITAGFTDGALFYEGQRSSYPNIMAGVMSLSVDNTMPSNYTQPYMDDNIGGLLLGGNQIGGPRLFFNGAGPQSLGDLGATPTTELMNSVPGPYSNMAVPGAQAIHMIAPGYGNLAGVADGTANPYAVRVMYIPGSSIIQDVLAQSPTFVSVWSGGNDALGYATGGGVGTLTSSADFDFAFGSTMAALSQVPGGVVSNIPDVTAIAYLNTIPYNAVPLDAATADMLNGGFAAYNGGLAVAQAFGLISANEVAARTVVYTAGQNAMLMEDEYLTDLSALGLPSWRQTTINDKIVLPAIGLIGTAVGGNPTQINGVSVPLADNIVLSADEISEAQARVVQFNTTIETLTAQQGWALYDAYGILNQAVIQGVAFDDYVMTTDLVFGGFFSLDGVHTTARGSALIANGMMEAIDAQYGSNLSDAAVKAGDYPTNYSSDLR